RLGEHGPRVLPDLPCVVLDAAGAREDLLVLALGGRDDRAGVVEDDRAGRGGALIDGDHVAGHRRLLRSLGEGGSALQRYRATTSAPGTAAFTSRRARSTSAARSSASQPSTDAMASA